MDEVEFMMLLPRAVNAALRMRKKLNTFHPNVYTEDGIQKIGYGTDLLSGISEPIAANIVKERLQRMGHALMRRAFELNLAGDSARFGVFVELATRVGEDQVLAEKPMWEAIKAKDYWKLHDSFLESPIITAYGTGQEGRRRVSYLSRVLVEGEAAI